MSEAEKEIMWKTIMVFDDPVIKPGRYITLRMGDSWFNRIKSGEKFLIADQSENKRIVGVGKVENMRYDSFKNITDEYVKNNKFLVPHIQSRSVALHEMKMMYQDFSENSYVTIIEFEVN